jgi:methionine aminotransferase
MKIKSKLPNVGETIFTTISKLANEKKAVNLGQGFPDFSGNQYLKDKISKYIQEDFNQYAPMIGVPKLRSSIASYFKRKYKLDLNYNTEITITSGATEALTASILAFVGKGDEVIVFDPSYDSYVPAIELSGAKSIRINLTETSFKLPIGELKKAINSNTKMIIINSPHNPTGSVVTESEWKEVSKLVANTNIIVLSDEVYEGICFDQTGHFCPQAIAELKNRLISVYSFGKSCHMTGWKVGFSISNSELTSEIRKLHQYFTFSTFSAAQMALADYLEEHMEDFLGLTNFYKLKKDFFVNGLKGSRFKVLDSMGTYFICVDYSDISELSDSEFVIELIQKHGIAAIPISCFYDNAPENQRVIRFCFAKSEETLTQALEILKNI